MQQAGGQSFPVQPIMSLSPFMGNKWWIKARVTDKGDIRTWNKPSGSGKLFSCTLVDETGAIRATFFNEAVDNFYSNLAPGKVYFFNNGQIKNANKKFNNVANDYELSLGEHAAIHATQAGDDAAIPQARYNTVPISILGQREVGSMADIIGVITEVSEVGKIITKARGDELTKRSVKIADTSAAVEVTLWNDSAVNWNYPAGTVVLIKACKIGSFDGVSLSTTMGSTIDANPAIPDTAKLAQWYSQTGGKDVSSLTVKNMGAGPGANSKGRRFFQDITDEGLGRGEKPDYIEVRCTPVHIRLESLSYLACPKTNKKVGEGNRCETCDKVVVPVRRYMCSVLFSDNVTQMWATLFDECGQQFFGLTAEELESRSTADASFITRKAQEILHTPMMCSFRVKEERFGDQAEASVRLNMTRLENFKDARLKTECDELIANINLYA